MASRTRPRPRLLALSWFLASAVLGTGCDLGSKAWAVKELTGGSQVLVDPWLELKLAYNTGTAFSLVRNLDAAMWLFGALAIAIVIGLTIYVIQARPPRWHTAALGCIAAGALGNGFDRLFRAAPGGGTGVVDFVSVTLPWGSRWPTFNIADALLVAGVGALLLLGLRASTPSDRAATG